MEEKKYYSITDIVKKYDTTRATMYYRFGLLTDYVHIIDETKVIDQEGLDILIKELDLKERNLDSEYDEKEDEEDSEIRESKSDETSRDDSGYNTGIIMEHIKLKDKELELKEKEIERLHDVINNLNNNLDKALELNKNNQVLLLEKNKQISNIKSIEENIIEMKESTMKTQDEEKIEESNINSIGTNAKNINTHNSSNTESSINTENKKGFWSRLFNKG